MSVACLTEYVIKNNLKKEGCIWLIVRLVVGKEGMGAGAYGGWSHCICIQEADRQSDRQT